jgi:toxin ParE1/3/4
MKRYRLTGQADADLTDVWLYIAADNAEAADRFLHRLLEKCQMLADHPGIGQARDELGPSLRSLPVGNYLVFYRAIDDGVEIVRVLSGFRDLEALFGP